jgi:D-alanyl-D-alanine carboxypeptidase
MVSVQAPEQKLAWTSAVGFADTSGTPLQPDQPVLIASNTKTYVAVAMLRLVEMGKFNIETPISRLLSPQTDSLFRADGYQTDSILVKHLLTHTSGIGDYTWGSYLDAVVEDPGHRWSRDEQLRLAVREQDPLAKPGQHFSYPDANYLLATEIMEQVSGKDNFVSIMRELLQFEKNGLTHTWFESLEPKATDKALALQTITSMNQDSYTIDPSFDLYGGGGIAATSTDLVRFFQLLFEKKLFEKEETLELMFTNIQTQDSVQADYYFGIGKSSVADMQAYGHGGFWGTVGQHVPELNASIAVFVLERDKREIRKDVLDAVGGVLKARIRGG